MKKLRKVLALVLVIALAFSLVTVASAATVNDYSDATSIEQKEPVDLFTQLGFIEGNAGAFNPTGTLTREAAAKIIAYMILGTSSANALKTVVSNFTDVAPTRWSAGYIQYCANSGIINGDGTGKFNPEAEVTGTQFAKMLLTAVGYGKAGEYTGPNWELNVIGDASRLFILDLDVDVTASATREQAINYAFNTFCFVAQVVYNSNTKSYQNAYDTYGAVTVDASALTLANDQGITRQSGILINGTTYHRWNWNNGIGVVTVSGLYPDDDVLGTSYDGTPIATLANMYSPKYIAMMNPAGCIITYNGAALTVVATGAAVTANSTYYNTTLGTIAKDTNGNAVADDAAFVIAKGMIVTFVNTNANVYAEVVNVIDKTVAKLTDDPIVLTNGNVTITAINGLNNILPGYVPGYDTFKKNDVVLYWRDPYGTYHIEKAASFTGTLNSYLSGVTYTVDTTAYGYAGLTGTSTPAAIEATYAMTGATYYTCDGGYLCYVVAGAPINPAAGYAFITSVAYSGVNRVATAVFYDGTTKVITVDPASDAATWARLGTLATAAHPLASAVNEFFGYTLTNNGATYRLTQVAVDGDTSANWIIDGVEARPLVGSENVAAGIRQTQYVGGAPTAAQLNITKNQPLFLTYGQPATLVTDVIAGGLSAFVYQNGASIGSYIGIANAPSLTADNSSTETIYTLYSASSLIWTYAVNGAYTPGTATDWVYIMNANPTLTWISATKSIFTYQALVNGVEKTVSIDTTKDAAIFNHVPGLCTTSTAMTRTAT